MPLALAALLAAAYLLAEPPSADLAAAVYRAGLFDREGLVLWDNGWYAGHHVPGYSVLFGPLAGWLGVRTVGALAVVGATALFAALVRDRPGGRGAAAWLAVAMTATVVSGRLPFALGCVAAFGAALAATRGRTGLAAGAGALTALCSPVAAMFLALAAAATVIRPQVRGETAGIQRYRRAFGGGWVAAGSAAVAVAAALVLAFPEGGTEPFVASAFWPALGASALAAAIAPAGTLRTGALLYGLLLAAAFVLPTPVGGNAARLGALLAGPLAVLVLWPGRRRLLALAALPLAYWTLYPAVRDWTEAHGDPAIEAAYYAPLLAELDRRGRGAPPARLEIPFTARHWEAAHVAPHVPLARGWERQYDRKVNALFYEGTLTHERYARWLRENAVRWVALSEAELDHSAEGEAGLIEERPPYLKPTWRSSDWTLYEVANALPLGARTVTPDGFGAPANTTLVRIRHSRWHRVVEGDGCVEEAPGGWTRVRARGPVRVAARLTGGGRCPS